MVYEVANGVLIYYLPEELDHYAADMLKRKTAHVFDGRRPAAAPGAGPVRRHVHGQFRHRADYRTVSDGA